MLIKTLKSCPKYILVYIKIDWENLYVYIYLYMHTYIYEYRAKQINKKVMHVCKVISSKKINKREKHTWRGKKCQLSHIINY